MKQATLFEENNQQLRNATSGKYSVHEEVFLKRVPILIEHMRVHKEDLIQEGVFPQYAFEELFNKPDKTQEAAAWLFLSAYFDSSKDSYTHYYKDMLGLYNAHQSGKLLNILEPDSKKHFDQAFNQSTTKPQQDIITYLAELNDKQINFFIRKAIKGPTYKINNPVIQEYVDQLSKEEIAKMPKKYHSRLRPYLKEDHIKNSDRFKKTLDTLVTTYQANPLNLFYNEEGFSDQLGAQRIQALPKGGIGNAYLTASYFAHAGLLPVNANELNINPKIEWSDAVITQLIGGIEVHTPSNIDQLRPGILQGMHAVANNTEYSLSEIDDAIWACAKMGKDHPPSFEKNPGRDYFSLKELQRNTSKTYYAESKIYPAWRELTNSH